MNSIAPEKFIATVLVQETFELAPDLCIYQSGPRYYRDAQMPEEQRDPNMTPPPMRCHGAFVRPPASTLP
ncbi:Uncharacterized protein OBRU01_10146 [Operophtera brumata]|uniref:Uncharacterized protein n=1 Tax=Operophtera brumata TaxID=104452 RepID=A0A0L7LBK1_OPEBR|nr:Uncharacterized protein OBRU01_10146 [Operophtera brumata]